MRPQRMMVLFGATGETSRNCRDLATAQVNTEPPGLIVQGGSWHAQEFRGWGESPFCLFKNPKNVRALGLLKAGGFRAGLVVDLLEFPQWGLKNGSGCQNNGSSYKILQLTDIPGPKI